MLADSATATGCWSVLMVASNKRFISLYVTAAAPDGGYLAETYKPRLPKASIGKSCIRFKRLGDVDQEVLERLLRRVAELGPPTA